MRKNAPLLMAGAGLAALLAGCMPAPVETASSQAVSEAPAMADEDEAASTMDQDKLNSSAVPEFSPGGNESWWSGDAAWEEWRRSLYSVLVPVRLF